MSMLAPARALDILLTNDDGFTSTNLRALYHALLADGHRVLVSAPCTGQSGKGGALDYFRPIGPLTHDCDGGTVRAGAPGVGSDPEVPSIHYVDGTPVMALLYGLDVLVSSSWGTPPDLVVSGPNVGQNTGITNPSSGTVNNAVIALQRGVPAIAVSADYSTGDDPALGDEVAGVVLRLLRQLQSTQGVDGLLPEGVGLNVNLPYFEAGQSGQLGFALARCDRYARFKPRFVEDLSQDPLAIQYGLDAPYPGISFDLRDPDPATDRPSSEGVVVEEGRVSVSLIEGNFDTGTGQYRAWAQLRLLLRLWPLFVRPMPGQGALAPSWSDILAPGS